MKTHHFKKIVDSDGTVVLSGLPTHKEVEIVVIYPETFDLQEEMKRWFEEVRRNHPFAKMTKEEVLVQLRKTREEMWDEEHTH